MDKHEVNEALDKINHLAIVYLASNTETAEQEAAVENLIYAIIPELKKLFTE